MPLTESNTHDYWGNPNPKCPFCDAVIEISAYELYELYEEGEHTFECPVCEKEVTVCTTVSHSFSTDEQPDPE